MSRDVPLFAGAAIALRQYGSSGKTFKMVCSATFVNRYELHILAYMLVARAHSGIAACLYCGSVPVWRRIRLPLAACACRFLECLYRVVYITSQFERTCVLITTFRR